MNILTKYSLFMIGLLILAVGSITGIALRYQQTELTREAILRGQSIAVNLALSSGDALLTRNLLHVVGLSVRATNDNDIVYAVVVDDREVIAGHPDPSLINKTFALNIIEPFRNEAVKADVVLVKEKKQRVWDISVPIIPKGTNRTLGRAHVGVAVSAVEESIRQSLKGLLGASVLLLVIGLYLTFVAIRYMVKPIEEISGASAKVGAGDLSVRVTVNSKDEIGELARNFNSMIENLKIAEHEKAEKQRIQSELHLATSIQAGLLPKKPPERDDVDMAFSCEPAKELGGDLYDWFELPQKEKLGFVIADVSGKGVPAALHMANLRNLFRFISAAEESPAEVLKKVNRLVFPDFRGEGFVTLIYAVYNSKDRTITMANAGHDPAYWVKRKKKEIIAIDSTSLPIGLVDYDDFDPEVQEEKIRVEKGDLFFTFTDGVTEAMNAEGMQFGLDRLQNCLAGVSDASSAVELVAAAVNKHAEGHEQSDDITMLSFISN